MNRLDNLKKMLVEKELEGKQVFNTRNILGDPMTNVYNEDEIQVDVCYRYDYVEIFGLTDDEWKEITEKSWFSEHIRNFPEFHVDDGNVVKKDESDALTVGRLKEILNTYPDDMFVCIDPSFEDTMTTALRVKKDHVYRFGVGEVPCVVIEG